VLVMLMLMFVCVSVVFFRVCLMSVLMLFVRCLSLVVVGGLWVMWCFVWWIVFICREV